MFKYTSPSLISSFEISKRLYNHLKNNPLKLKKVYSYFLGIKVRKDGGALKLSKTAIGKIKSRQKWLKLLRNTILLFLAIFFAILATSALVGTYMLNDTLHLQDLARHRQAPFS